MKPLSDLLDQEWENYLACDKKECPERGEYFRCYMIDYEPCWLYKNKVGTNCTQ